MGGAQQDEEAEQLLREWSERVDELSDEEQFDQILEEMDAFAIFGVCVNEYDEDRNAVGSYVYSEDNGNEEAAAALKEVLVDEVMSTFYAEQEF